MTWTDLYFRMFILTAETEPTAVGETGLGSVQPWGEARVVVMVGRGLALD